MRYINVRRLQQQQQLLLLLLLLLLSDWTWGHQPDHSPLYAQIMVCRSLGKMHVKWGGIYFFSAAPEDFARSNSTWKFFQHLLYIVLSLQQIQFLNQNTLFFVEQHVYTQQWRVKIRHWLTWSVWNYCWITVHGSSAFVMTCHPISCHFLIFGI